MSRSRAAAISPTPKARQRQPVALVNETMADRFWPNEDPSGTPVPVERSAITDSFTIIGVVRDVQHFEIESADERGARLCAVSLWRDTQYGLTIRVAAGDPTAITAAVREARFGVSTRAFPLFNVRR